MKFLYDYLAAIQFAAALNIGYIIPDLLRKMYGVLHDVDDGYKKTIQNLKSTIVVKAEEIGNIKVLSSVSDSRKTTKNAIDGLTDKLRDYKSECEEKENSLNVSVEKYIKCNGYRSLFFFAALYSIVALFAVPFLYHADISCFHQVLLDLFNIFAIGYLIVQFFVVIARLKDQSCQGALAFFALFFVLSITFAVLNNHYEWLTELDSSVQDRWAALTVIVPFLPGFACLSFLVILIIRAWVSAFVFSCKVKIQIRKIDKKSNPLKTVNDLLKEDVSFSGKQDEKKDEA